MKPQPQTRFPHVVPARGGTDLSRDKEGKVTWPELTQDTFTLAFTFRVP